MGSGWLRSEVLEVLSECVNTHLANSLTVTATDINTALLSLLFSCHKDIVPLIELGISDFLVELGIGTIDFNFEASFVQVEHHTRAVVKIFLRDRDHDSLARRKEEGPLSSQVLNKNGNKALN
jgi:hypothetical protein